MGEQDGGERETHFFRLHLLSLLYCSRLRVRVQQAIAPASREQDQTYYQEDYLIAQY